jgi:hypothetical protein
LRPYEINRWGSAEVSLNYCHCRSSPTPDRSDDRKTAQIKAMNAIYSRYFPKDPPARIFVNVPAWPGHFDIEIDCVAAV